MGASIIHCFYNMENVKHQHFVTHWCQFATNWGQSYSRCYSVLTVQHPVPLALCLVAMDTLGPHPVVPESVAQPVRHLLGGCEDESFVVGLLLYTFHKV